MEIILRATAIYLFVYLVIRVMGKRELGEMSAFELILLVMIGDLVQQAVTQEDYSVTGAVLAVGTIAFWVVVTSYASFRWNRASRVLESPPIVVIDNGRVQREILHTERVDERELRAPLASTGSATSETSSLPCWRPTGSSRSSSGSPPGNRSQRNTSPRAERRLLTGT